MMNTIGIDNNLDMPRIRKLLKIGLFASLIAAAGDMILGYGLRDESMTGMEYFFSLYGKASDFRMVSCSIMGMFGMTLELLCLFAVYRLIAYKSLRYAHAYRTGIFGCLIFGPCGYHVQFVGMFFIYKKLNDAGYESLETVLRYACYFIIPAVILFFASLMILTITQVKAFASGKTPLPKWNLVFSILTAFPIYIICEVFGNYALINAISTAWFHLGCVWMYGGLLMSMNKNYKISFPKPS